MIKQDAFYANNTRLVRATFDGFTAGNTDKGLLYFNLVVSGGTATLTYYKWSTKASGDAVASGSASVESDTMTEITLAASNASGMTATATFDLTSSSASITDGKVIVSFSFDDDLKLKEKQVSSLAPSNQWEGEGSAGCAFVRAHRVATVWCLEQMRMRLRGQVNLDAKDLPDLFDVDFSMEDLRNAGVHRALYHIYWNRKNSPLADEDPHALMALWYKDESESIMNSISIHLDLDGDGTIDATDVGGTYRWV